MKKLLSIIILALVAASQAQSVDVNNGTLILKSCYGIKEGVECEFQYTLTDLQNASPKWYTSQFSATSKPDLEVGANSVAFGDNIFDTYSTIKEAAANKPIKLLVRFNLVNSTTKLLKLKIVAKTFENVPV